MKERANQSLTPKPRGKLRCLTFNKHLMCASLLAAANSTAPIRRCFKFNIFFPPSGRLVASAKKF